MLAIDRMYLFLCFLRMDVYGGNDAIVYTSRPLSTTSTMMNNWTWELGGNLSLNPNEVDNGNESANNGSSYSIEDDEDDPFTTVSLTCIGK